jgi:hypothetical protein
MHRRLAVPGKRNSAQRDLFVPQPAEFGTHLPGDPLGIDKGRLAGFGRVPAELAVRAIKRAEFLIARQQVNLTYS